MLHTTGLGLALSVCALGMGCGADSPENAFWTKRNSLVVNPDGNYTAKSQTDVVNKYAPLTVSASVGDAQVTVQNVAGLGLSQDDLVMIIQMQGADMRSTDDEQYGAVQNIQGSGHYELLRVRSVDTTGSRVLLDARCGGLRNAYSVAGKTQVVRVPQYGNVSVPVNTSIIGRAWDGQTGGIVAIRASGAFSVEGAIDASGQGFRGGAAQTGLATQTDETPDRAGFRVGTAAQGAAKGEGVAGGATEYATQGGPFGRGAPANGGGGGNGFKSGGGGGANGGVGFAYDGHGVMNPNAVGKTAWDLDPAKVAQNKLTASGGGGRGGYSGSTSDKDATTVAPGDAAWAGNQRRERGGRGGHPLLQDPKARLFLGGGGGGGDANGKTAANGAAGGSGGGLVWLWGTRLSGSGKIQANGNPGASTTGPSHDQGAGGGGGGGTAALLVPSLEGTLSVQANGGLGGMHGNPSGTDAAGPGGGGGGGVLVLPAIAPISVTRAAIGAAEGGTLATALSEFPANGATRGNDGDELSYSPGDALPGCFLTDLSVSVSSSQKSAVPGRVFTLQVTVENVGTELALGAPVSGVLTPGGMSSVNWTCTATPTASGEVADCNPNRGFQTLSSAASLSGGQKATYRVSVSVPSSATGQLVYQASVGTPSGATEENPANNTASLSVPIQPSADVQALVTLTPQTPSKGQPVTVIAAARNMGPSDARDVELRFSIPAGFRASQEPFSATLSCSGTAQDGYVCRGAQLSNMKTNEAVVVLEPTEDLPELVFSADASSAVPDDLPENNTASASVLYDFALPSYRSVQLGGGGFGCSVTPFFATRTSSSAAFATFAASSAIFFLRRRRRPIR